MSIGVRFYFTRFDCSCQTHVFNRVEKNLNQLLWCLLSFSKLIIICPKHDFVTNRIVYDIKYTIIQFNRRTRDKCLCSEQKCHLKTWKTITRSGMTELHLRVMSFLWKIDTWNKKAKQITRTALNPKKSTPKRIYGLQFVCANISASFLSNRLMNGLKITFECQQKQADATGNVLLHSKWKIVHRHKTVIHLMWLTIFQRRDF